MGIISEISDTYATVETICSPNLSIGAKASDKSESGIVEGDVTLSFNYRCRMIYLEKDTTLKSGDLITTSNSVGIFPQGYLIGSVESIEPMDNGLSYCAVIRPSVDLENLKNVIVIKDFAGKELRGCGKVSEVSHPETSPPPEAAECHTLGLVCSLHFSGFCDRKRR